MTLMPVGMLIAGCHSQKVTPKPSVEITPMPAASPGGLMSACPVLKN